MKKSYIQPSITVVRLQQQHIICTSPGDYDGQSVGIQSGEINEESAVWTKESRSVWEEEW